jgi:replicative DNA helicase
VRFDGEQDRVTPHDLEAENWVLGGILVQPVLFAHVADLLTPEDFWRREHQAIYAAMQRATNAGYSADHGSVRRELEAVSSEVPASELWQLGDGMPRGVNVREYAKRIADRADERKWIEAAKRLATAAYDGDDIGEALGSMPARRGAHARPQALTAALQAQALEADLVREAAGPKVWLGLPAIDNCLGGVQPGEVLGILARPAVGKTLVLCHALHYIASELNALCFSLEMPASQIVRRLARMAFGYGARDLAEGRFDAETYVAQFARLTLDATGGLSVAQIRLRAQAIERTSHAPKVVLIDHLGLIGGDPKLPTYDRVSKQARELKEMAKDLDVAVIVLIQVNRDKGGGDGSRELDMGSARDSGVVEEACDYMVALRRLDRNPNLTESDRFRFKDVIFAKPLKNRHGSLIEEVAYRMDPRTLRLSEDSAMRAIGDDASDRAAERAGRRR